MASRTKSAGRKGRAANRPQVPPAARRVERVRRLLMRRSLPRVQMSLILAATGAAGFLTSFALLHLGVWRMWLRYPLAVLFAYGVFVALLRVWLFLHGRGPRGRSLDLDLDALDMAADIAREGVGRVGTAPDTFGGGGDFGGGGVGGSWGDGAGGVLNHAPTAYDAGGVGLGSGGGGGGDWLSGLDFDFDSDSVGCVLFLLAVALIAAGVCASLYVVYAAPLLLAEVLVEGVLLSGLYRGMRRARRGGGDWLGAVLRRTWLPVLLTLLTFAGAGYLLQRAAPRARSIGEAFHAVTSD